MSEYKISSMLKSKSRDEAVDLELELRLEMIQDEGIAKSIGNR